jgi:hypothetical protein
VWPSCSPCARRGGRLRPGRATRRRGATTAAAVASPQVLWACPPALRSARRPPAQRPSAQARRRAPPESWPCSRVGIGPRCDGSAAPKRAFAPAYAYVPSGAGVHDPLPEPHSFAHAPTCVRGGFRLRPGSSLARWCAERPVAASSPRPRRLRPEPRPEPVQGARRAAPRPAAMARGSPATTAAAAATGDRRIPSRRPRAECRGGRRARRTRRLPRARSSPQARPRPHRRLRKR